uniref:probable phospholipid-transporting ATPase VD n=1 Tax=Styela clava TaxID=7725 RepID=UPI001939F43D|nr:probable phospholipid-transporting ATPase VD [Styela clava]
MASILRYFGWSGLDSDDEKDEFDHDEENGSDPRSNLSNPANETESSHSAPENSGTREKKLGKRLIFSIPELDSGNEHEHNLSTLYPRAFASWKKQKKRFLPNKVKTTKYTILSFLPKNLFEQFHRYANFYFLFIVILNFTPMINAFDKYLAIIPLAVVLTFTAVKDIVEDVQKYKNDQRVNNMKCIVYNRMEKDVILLFDANK